MLCGSNLMLVKEFELSNRYILSCHTHFIDEHLPWKHQWVTRDLLIGLVQITRDYIFATGIDNHPISSYLNWDALLSDFFWLHVREIQQHVIDCGGQCWKEYHRGSKDCDVFEYVDNAAYILQDEEWLGHCVKEVLPITWNLHVVFIQSIYQSSLMNFFIVKSCMWKMRVSVAAELVDVI